MQNCKSSKIGFQDFSLHIFIYSPNSRFLVQETFPKTLPQFALILISLQRWQHRVRNETKHFVSPHLIGPQFLANQHETNQHKSAAFDWSISRDPLGAAICGELPKLSETDAERSTGLPLLSAVESNFYMKSAISRQKL